MRVYAMRVCIVLLVLLATASTTFTSHDDIDKESATYASNTTLPSIKPDTTVLTAKRDDDQLTQSKNKSLRLALRVSSFLNLYVEGVMLFVGLICNLLIFIVFLGKRYRQSSFHVYARSLTAIDILLLGVCLTIHWVNYNFLTDNKHIDLCRATVFLVRVFFDAEAWLIVTMTLDRLIVVCRPFHAKTWLTKSRAYIVVVCLFVASVGKNAYTIRVAGFSMKKTNNLQCVLLYNKTLTPDAIFSWLDLLADSALPFILLMLFNIGIINQIRRADKQRCALSPSQINDRQITRSLLLVSLVFLVFTLPRKVNTLYWSYAEAQITAESRSAYLYSHTVTQKLWFLNCCVNIWLYCAAGRFFRGDLLRTTCFWRNTRNKDMKQMNVSKQGTGSTRVSTVS